MYQGRLQTSCKEGSGGSWLTTQHLPSSAYTWCNSVGQCVDENPKRLLVIEETSVGVRKACKACDEPLQA